MKKDTRVISTLNMSREDWLQQRRQSIGGSDASAVLGLSKWSSPYTVWADKTGRLPEKEDSEAMRLGRDLEKYVASRWCEATDKKVRRCNFILRNNEYPWAHADVDRLVVGEDAGLECKTTSALDLRMFKDVEFPTQYYAQCVHYMAVTGMQRWYLAVLVYGRGFYTYTLERDEEEIAALMQAEETFWRYVEQGVPPPIDGSDATADALSTIYKGSNPETWELYGMEAALEDRRRMKEQIELLEHSVQRIDSSIKDQMKDRESAYCGDWRVSWKAQTRRSFDWKKLAKQHPEISLDPYFKTTSTRPLTIRKTN